MNTPYEIPKDLGQAAKLIEVIFRLYQDAPDYKSFINYNKGDFKDASHRLRKVHDEFLQDAFRHGCIGTIYRTEGVLTSNSMVPGAVHCEHVIPNNLLAKHIYFHLRPSTYVDLAKFVFRNRVICATTKEEQKKELRTLRPFNGKTSRWGSTHPNFLKQNGALVSIPVPNGSMDDVRPFWRYYGTDLRVFNVLTGTEVDHENYTMRDHYETCDKHQGDLEKVFLKAIMKHGG